LNLRSHAGDYGWSVLPLTRPHVEEADDKAILEASQVCDDFGSFRDVL
jgi:hypothetical protein